MTELRRDYPGFLLILALLGGVSSPARAGSFLYQPAYSIDPYLRLPATPYCPQPGDLVFAMTESGVMRMGHRVAGAADPHHSGIVFGRSDGSLAVLEAGPFNKLVVTGWDVMTHLSLYEKSERVWVRRRRCPLTPAQSARLTGFCEAQVGKTFAALRVAGQLTPFRSRGTEITSTRGCVRGDREAWFCAELVVESLVAACLLDPATARPSATYPRDLFLDSSPDPWLDRYLKLSAGWWPPALWTSAPYGTAGYVPRRVYRSVFRER